MFFTFGRGVVNIQNMERRDPVLFYDTSKDSRKAAQAVMTSHIKAEFIATQDNTQHELPWLSDNYRPYVGVVEIKRFLERASR